MTFDDDLQLDIQRLRDAAGVANDLGAQKIRDLFDLSVELIMRLSHALADIQLAEKISQKQKEEEPVCCGACETCISYGPADENHLTDYCTSSPHKHSCFVVNYRCGRWVGKL